MPQFKKEGKMETILLSKSDLKALKKRNVVSAIKINRNHIEIAKEMIIR